MSATITIQGVPESVTRERVCELLRALGLDPMDLVSFSLDLQGVHVEVLARNGQGLSFTADGENVATHRLTIPIIEEKP